MESAIIEPGQYDGSDNMLLIWSDVSWLGA